jgi:hypothetical protein
MAATRFTAGLFTILALTGVASAADVRGLIVRVDPDKKELILEGRGGGLRGMPLAFLLDKDTEVLFGRQPGTLADLAPGRRVRLTIEDRDGRPVARVIHVVGARPAAPAPPPGGDGISGVLQRVAFTDREIVVIGPGPKGPETETTIAVTDATKIRKGDKTVAFEELKEGEAVTVQAEKRDSRLTAVTIQVGPSGPVPAMAPEQRDLLPRIRRALQMADKILEQMEKSREKQP